MTEYATLPQIIFVNDDRPTFEVGEIGYYEGNRIPPHSPFVIVGVSDNYIKIIRPTMKIVEGKVLFGIDNNTKLNGFECSCEVYQGCDGSCRCGAKEKNVELYMNSFTEATSDYKYVVSYERTADRRCGDLDLCAICNLNELQEILDNYP